MKVISRQLEIQTHRRTELVNITDLVKEVVLRSEVRNGLCTVFTRHTTTGIMINENEPGLELDVVRFLEKLVPYEGNYFHHHYFYKDGRMAVNAWAHLRSILLGASVVIPIEDGKLQLGGRENIYLVELDGPQLRRVVVHVMGD